MASGFGQRPYSEPGATLGNAGRTGQFNTGQTGEQDPGNIASVLSAAPDPSLVSRSLQFNSQVTGARPTSVLQPLMRNPGGNGMSAADAARRTVTGQYLGSVNGTSQSSFEPAAMLRLSGLDSQ